MYHKIEPLTILKQNGQKTSPVLVYAIYIEIENILGNFIPTP